MPKNIIIYAHYRYAVEEEYDRDTNCAERGCDSICRCGRITNERVVKSDVDHTTFVLYHIPADSKTKRKRKYKPSLIELYCIDRLCSVYQTKDPDQYSVSVGSGYYGQEITGVYFDSAHQLESDIKHVIGLKKNVDKIRFVLEREYLHLIEPVKAAKSVQVVKRDPKKLFSNAHHMQMVKRAGYGFEVDWSLPQGIIHNDNLIDGYHRTCNALGHGKRSVKYVELLEDKTDE